jgi:hypothetical protein
VVKLRKFEDIVAKWAEVTPGRAPYYEKGIREPKKNWEEEAINAEGAWESGVTAAVTEKRFAGGVKKAGFATWQKKALALGVPRWPDGVRKARDDYSAGWKPYYDVLTALVLPERGAKGDPKNIDRVRAIADALHKKKLELLKAA